ncbi:MAG: cell division protein FtsL [Algicola sp.]|nr:cell division protein FtsL [Algicola sp.]
MTQIKRQPNLAKEIFNDLFRHKLVLLFILVNVISALFIVQFAHMNRLAFIEQDRLLQQRDELDIQWRHNLIEQRTLAEHSRIEAIVGEKLGLYRPRLADEVVVSVL